jgi:glycosyltransferase involved in cell wall biosynthesis
MKIAITINIPLQHRTGVEEYLYHLLWNLPTIDGFKEHQFFILAPFVTEDLEKITKQYKYQILKWPFIKFWTLIRLSWEMRKKEYDILFVPVHTFPIIHPRLVITVQGLEFEKLPKMYPFFKRKFLRWITKRNTRRAEKIIVPSTSSKNDLIKYYHINPEKIFVVHHGVGNPPEIPSSNYQLPNTEYILYLGRGDRRKNINGLIKAFRILKHDHQIPHKLVLVGPNIGYKITRDLREDVICTGYVDDARKWQLLENADVFVYPSFYEGFGIPILEAQKVGVPVVCSSTSSMPELVFNPANREPSALMVNPYKPSEIAEAIHKIIRNQVFSDELVKRGLENVKRFSWSKCAKETLDVILK